MLLISTTTWAKTANVDGLTAEQQAEIQLLIAQTKAQNRNTNTTLPNISKSQVKEYVVLGESIAKALGACAKEMGVAVNDFANSKVGILATVLIIWNLAGEDIMGFIVGISLLIVFIPTWIYFYKRMCIISNITYHENGKKKEIKHYTSDSGFTSGDLDACRVLMFISLIIIISICCMIMFA